MRKVIIIFLTIVFVLALVIGGGIIYLNRGLDKVGKVEVKPINLATIEDGTYKGKYEGYRWSNELEITIKNHQIVKITVIDDVVFVKPEVSEELFARIIDQQNIDVEVVTGATATSKAYLKAIENGLNE